MSSSLTTWPGREGTWPEVLRRFVLTRAGEEAPYL